MAVNQPRRMVQPAATLGQIDQMRAQRGMGNAMPAGGLSPNLAPGSGGMAMIGPGGKPMYLPSGGISTKPALDPDFPPTGGGLPPGSGGIPGRFDQPATPFIPPDAGGLPPGAGGPNGPLIQPPPYRPITETVLVPGREPGSKPVRVPVGNGQNISTKPAPVPPGQREAAYRAQQQVQLLRQQAQMRRGSPMSLNQIDEQRAALGMAGSMPR